MAAAAAGPDSGSSVKVESAEFVKSAHASGDFVRDGRPEIAFVGRSNVGKSSLMNRLLARKGLAKVSSTPGRTRSVNYFLVNRRFWFVDLPGYGYAKAGKEDRREWAALADRYFRSPGDLHEPDKLRGFLYGIAIRVARSELRRRRLRRWLRLTDEGVVPDVDSAPLDADAREAVARLYAILDRTSDEARLLFVLRCIEKLEVAEVAACLDLPLGTTKRKLGKVVPHIFAIARRDPLLAEYIRRSGEITEEIQEESDET